MGNPDREAVACQHIHLAWMCRGMPTVPRAQRKAKADAMVAEFMATQEKLSGRDRELATWAIERWLPVYRETMDDLCRRIWGGEDE